MGFDKNGSNPSVDCREEGPHWTCMFVTQTRLTPELKNISHLGCVWGRRDIHSLIQVLVWYVSQNICSHTFWVSVSVI